MRLNFTLFLAFAPWASIWQLSLLYFFLPTAVFLFFVDLIPILHATLPNALFVSFSGYSLSGVISSFPSI